MSSSDNAPNRGQARVWLKYVVTSGVLDRLSSQYDHEGDVNDPRSDVLDLLNELRDTDAAGRPVVEILTDVRRLCAWVEGRQKDARRIILAEGGPDDGVIDRLIRRRDDSRSSGAHAQRPMEPQPRRPAAPSPRSHPLFDDWLDG